MSVYEQWMELVDKTYEKIKELPKPEKSKIGGTYYGSTQLFSSVGNHLDLIEDSLYDQRSYGGGTTRYNLYGIRIGGAYNPHTSGILDELKAFLKENREKIFKEGLAIIDDYGTNFSVIGLGYRV